MAVLGAATPRRVWYRRPPSQFALLALPFVRTEFTYLLGRGPRLAPGKGRWNWARQANYDPVASSEIPALNASRPAAVGRDLSERVLAAQGPDGQLATRHLEKHQHPVQLAPYIRVVANWSPDGQSDHCR
jgi:hypothetical protein